MGRPLTQEDVKVWQEWKENREEVRENCKRKARQRVYEKYGVGLYQAQEEARYEKGGAGWTVVSAAILFSMSGPLVGVLADRLGMSFGPKKERQLQAVCRFYEKVAKEKFRKARKDFYESRGSPEPDMSIERELEIANRGA